MQKPDSIERADINQPNDLNSTEMIAIKGGLRPLNAALTSNTCADDADSSKLRKGLKLRNCRSLRQPAAAELI